MSDNRKHLRLNQAFLYVEDEFLDIAEREKKVWKRRKRMKRLICTAAACICLFLVLPAAVMAYNWFGLRNLVLPEKPDDLEGITESGTEYITLSGYLNSPEALALAEWEDFLTNYDIAGEIGTENTSFVAEGRNDWTLYAVYSYEMGEKLDEIAEKYGLKLYSEINSVSPEELEKRIGGAFMEGGTKYWGYIYGDGTFQFDGEAALDGCGLVSFQFRRAVKGTLGDVVLSVGQANEYTEWQYLSACGEPVLLALGPQKALIFADFDKCFITVNVLSGSHAGMTAVDLEELADKIEFGVLKNVQKPIMSGDS